MIPLSAINRRPRRRRRCRSRGRFLPPPPPVGDRSPRLRITRRARALNRAARTRIRDHRRPCPSTGGAPSPPCATTWSTAGCLRPRTHATMAGSRSGYRRAHSASCAPGPSPPGSALSSLIAILNTWPTLHDAARGLAGGRVVRSHCLRVSPSIIVIDTLPTVGKAVAHSYTRKRSPSSHFRSSACLSAPVMAARFWPRCPRGHRLSLRNVTLGDSPNAAR
jgi:hypothetical protein